MKLIKKYLMPYKLFVFLAPVFMFLEVMTEVFLPKIMTQIISIGVTNNDSAYITKMFFLMIGLSLLGILGGVGCLVVASLASQKAGTDIRLDLFEKIQAFSFHNIDKFKPSSLITRLTNDITQIQLVILMSLRLLIRSPLLSIGSIIMAVSINAKLSVIFLIMIPLVVIVMIVISKKAFPLFDAVQKNLIM